MSITVLITQIFRVTEVDGLGSGGRTTGHRVATIRGTAMDRYDEKLLTLSAGLSLFAVNLEPLTPSAPGSLLWFQANQPVDVRLNDASAAAITGVRSLLMAAVLSALYLTTVDSGVTIIRLDALGGGTVTANVSFS